MRQNFSEIFTLTSTLINNGSQIRFIGKDIDLTIGKTGRYFTKLDTARLQVMDEGHGSSGTAQVIQDRYGVMLGQQWLNSQETFFVAQSGRADFCGSEDKEISSIKDVDKKGLTTSVIFSNSLRIGIIKLSKFRIPLSKTLAQIGEPVAQNITSIYFQEHIFSHFGTNGVSISNILDDERLCFRHTSRDSDMAEGLQNPTRVMVLTNWFDSAQCSFPMFIFGQNERVEIFYASFREHFNDR